ncbi:hypothetical protein Q7C36_007045 [Tachysurus vachellii]|uniref:Uncharacterized protein n=1 Tax=Tachysurus vachellii TaxID=175792 RepID=A0AA88NBD0_TACVA|nr:hypothetical protein Q7C36_007045 [Tachysurus vachellii]
MHKQADDISYSCLCKSSEDTSGYTVPETSDQQATEQKTGFKFSVFSLQVSKLWDFTSASSRVNKLTAEPKVHFQQAVH